MATTKETTTINIRNVPLALWREAKSHAARQGITATTFVVQALAERLEDLEDAYEADKAYKEFLESGEEAIPLEQVRRNLGLDD